MNERQCMRARNGEHLLVWSLFVSTKPANATNRFDRGFLFGGRELEIKLTTHPNYGKYCVAIAQWNTSHTERDRAQSCEKVFKQIWLTGGYFWYIRKCSRSLSVPFATLIYHSLALLSLFSFHSVWPIHRHICECV